MNSLYLGWRSPSKAKWYPVGRLTKNSHYEFNYVKGAEIAQHDSNFMPLKNFPDLNEKYESDDLFPMFANRLMPESRPEFKDFLNDLNISKEHKDDPIYILARSGGRSATDTFELFPTPDIENNAYHIHFFSHGLTHLPASSIDRINRLNPEDQLKLMVDFQNPFDPNALSLRTDDTARTEENDLHILGYVPTYFVEDIHKLTQETNVEVTVERVNKTPTPLRFRLLCNLTATCHEGFKPFDYDIYSPLSG